MFGKIKNITNNIATIELIKSGEIVPDVLNIQVIFEAQNQRILGEIKDINETELSIKFLGEFENDRYIPGVLKKPSLNSTIRVINENELSILMGKNEVSSLLLGKSPLYNKFPIYVNINNFFSSHVAIFGNSGSGKSCGVARIIQNIFGNSNFLSYNANLFFFDAYGEYRNAFKSINQINPNYQYKFISTNPTEQDDEPLEIPFHLLTLDDLVLLLQVNDHQQIPILERALKLCRIFATNDEQSRRYKNNLIAKAILAVLFSNSTAAQKKNEIFRVIASCSTPEFSYTTIINGIGYTRQLSECFEVDRNGQFGESVLINEYILKHIDEKLKYDVLPDNIYYTIDDFSKAFDFTLISEGFQHNSNIQDLASILKVRLSSIINSPSKKYFSFTRNITRDSYISYLVAKNSHRSQIININLEDMDDTLAKTIVKIFARMLFDFTKTRQNRASIPFHLFLEESHRYIQKDNDTFILGYNVFDRIAKEGRKYGLLLDLISQRPVEISDTVISQVSNFLIFKMTHPLDLDYIERMLPNMSADILDKLNSLQPGTCVAFGSAFKIPMICRLDMPNPEPYSGNCDIVNIWKAKQ